MRYLNLFKKRDPTPLGGNVVLLGKMIVYYRIGLERQFNEDKTLLATPLDQTRWG